MKGFFSTTSLAFVLGSLVGCTSAARDTAIVSRQQEDASAYCHKTLQPVGPTDPARTNQNRVGDYIDYYGPCSGPSTADQIQRQKRFEQFRFGRDYMDEG
jgi:hypothetical protein